MKLDLPRTALVITDPQIDFLSPDGVTWGVVGESVMEHNTVANIGRLFAAAKAANLTVAVSPHYYYPTDKGWRFEGALEKLMHAIGMFDRASPYTMEGFENSGADFMPEYK
jgi:nicotinamidase-related amidase